MVLDNQKVGIAFHLIINQKKLRQTYKICLHSKATLHYSNYV